MKKTNEINGSERSLAFLLDRTIFSQEQSKTLSPQGVEAIS